MSASALLYEGSRNQVLSYTDSLYAELYTRVEKGKRRIARIFRREMKLIPENENAFSVVSARMPKL